MESQIEKLIEKYWAGETTLKEEALIRDYFLKNPSLTPQGRYFSAVSALSESKVRFRHPARVRARTWLSVAASLVVGLLVALLVLEDANRHRDFMVEDPEKAYEITRKALRVVSASLNEGRDYSRELEKINEAEKIVSELEN